MQVELICCTCQCSDSIAERLWSLLQNQKSVVSGVRILVFAIEFYLWKNWLLLQDNGSWKKKSSSQAIDFIKDVSEKISPHLTSDTYRKRGDDYDPDLQKIGILYDSVHSFFFFGGKCLSNTLWYARCVRRYNLLFNTIKSTQHLQTDVRAFWCSIIKHFCSEREYRRS